MSEPYGSERSIMPGGQCAFQVPIGRPTMRWAIPAARRWAAIDSPNGPAPMIRTSSAGTGCSLPEGFGFRGGGFRLLLRMAAAVVRISARTGRRSRRSQQS